MRKKLKWMLMTGMLVFSLALPGCACNRGDEGGSRRENNKTQDEDDEKEKPKSKEREQSEKIEAELATAAVVEQTEVEEATLTYMLETTVRIPAFSKYFKELETAAEEACTSDAADEFELRLMELVMKRVTGETEVSNTEISGDTDSNPGKDTETEPKDSGDVDGADQSNANEDGALPVPTEEPKQLAVADDIEYVTYDLTIDLLDANPEKDPTTWTEEELRELAGKAAFEKEMDKYLEELVAESMADVFRRLSENGGKGDGSNE